MAQDVLVKIVRADKTSVPTSDSLFTDEERAEIVRIVFAAICSQLEG